MISTVVLPAVLALPPTAGCVIGLIQVVRLRRQLCTDRLSGLANRDGLLRMFARARRRGGPAIGVLLVDLDRFKQVNDRLGHGVGNAVLQHVAGQLAGAVGVAGVAVRLHGDEFAVLLPRLPPGRAGHQAAQRMAKRVSAAVAAPMPIGRVTWGVTASVGAAVSPRAHADLSALLRVADQRMYATKRDAKPWVKR